MVSRGCVIRPRSGVLSDLSIRAIQMARRYPHAEVVGIDLAPPLVPL